MNTIAVQISPEAKGAYFAEYRHIAECEFKQVFGDKALKYKKFGSLEFFLIEDLELELARLLRLSFVQGVYSVAGDLFRPLDQAVCFDLHEDFVFGSKYKGKTNERLTQMLINVGLAAIGAEDGVGKRLLDPMCGRATTLLWALRYGMVARGIEQDSRALDDIRRNLKKWTKLHRQKHKMSEGVIGRPNKKNHGKFLDFSVKSTSMRVAIGDSREADTLYKKESFDLIISDLPYGVQHTTTDKSRNPLSEVATALESWKNCLNQDGAIVLAFNRYSPKREALTDAFVQKGFEVLPFGAEHRMSESIVRDVVIFRHGG